MLKESLNRLWDYRYEGAMLRYLQNWIDQLRWQRLKPLEKLAPLSTPAFGRHGVLGHASRSGTPADRAAPVFQADSTGLSRTHHVSPRSLYRYMRRAHAGYPVVRVSHHQK